MLPIGNTQRAAYKSYHDYISAQLKEPDPEEPLPKENGELDLNFLVSGPLYRNSPFEDLVTRKVTEARFKTPLAKQVASQYARALVANNIEQVLDELDITDSKNLVQLGNIAILKIFLSDICESEKTSIERRINNAIFLLTHNQNEEKTQQITDSVQRLFIPHYSELQNTPVEKFKKYTQQLIFLENLAYIKGNLRNLDFPVDFNFLILDAENQETRNNTAKIAELIKCKKFTEARNFLRFSMLPKEIQDAINKFINTFSDHEINKFHAEFMIEAENKDTGNKLLKKNERKKADTYLKYKLGQSKIKAQEKRSLAQFPDPETNRSSIRLFIANFLINRNLHDELPRAILFLEKLAELKAYRYKDGSKIEGVEKIFLNAYLNDTKKAGTVFGFYFEPLVSLALIQKGFKVESVSATSYNGKLLRTRDNQIREIDAIATKDGKTFFINVKAGLKSIEESYYKSRLSGFSELARAHKSTPVIVLYTKDKFGKGRYDKFFAKERDFMKSELTLLREVLTTYPNLSIWDHNIVDITSYFCPDRKNLVSA